MLTHFHWLLIYPSYHKHHSWREREREERERERGEGSNYYTFSIAIQIIPIVPVILQPIQLEK